jgi:hypothetical protein
VALVSVPAPEAGASESGELAQVTPICPGSLRALAVNVCVPPASSVAVDGSMLTAGLGSVIVAVALRVASVTEVAVMVAVTSLVGGIAGAV